MIGLPGRLWRFFHRPTLERNMASTKAAAATVEDIARDMQALRDDLAQLSRQVTTLLSASSDEAIGEVKERIRRMRDTIDETVADAGERGREALSDVSGKVSEALEGALQEHPVTAVALALGLGFLFGTMLRR
jgi:ElaB/YqjD/DUF883 family membrane-anchored ribosome-binding protein